MYLICYFFVLFLMRRRPPRSTLPSTLFPFTMLFRSDFNAPVEQIRESAAEYSRKRPHGRFACAWLSWRHIPSVFCAARESEPLQDLVKLCLSSRFSRSSRSEEHTSELQSLMRISYAVFCLKKKKSIT